MRFRIKLSPKATLSISAIIAIVMIASSYIELKQSKKEIFSLLYEHSSTLLQSIIKSSENTLNSSFEIEDLITERLLDNARMIKKLDSLNSLTKSELINLSKQNNLYRINIFNNKGNRVLSNRVPEPGHMHGEENINRYNELVPILNGETNQLIIGLKNAEFSDGERYAVAVARANHRGAIVVNLDAKDFLEFRKKIGIGIILNGMSAHHGIEYIILQDTLGILAASEKIDSVEAINGSDFLMKAMTSDSVFSRTIDQSGIEVYEVVQRFMLDNDLIGIYRLGISLEDIRNVEDRMLRRLIIISLILAAILIIVLSIIFTNQNLQTISKEYDKFKTLTSSVLENMSEAVIVLDKENKITLFNKSAEKLFKINSDNVIGNDILSIRAGVLDFIQTNISNIKNTTTNFEKQLSLDDEEKTLLFSISQLIDPDTQQLNFTIVIKDLTDTRRLEEESKRNEKLSAMGELASGVAHEIRNPINAIGMIAQRLNKEFLPAANQNEYSDITQLLRTEVNRINKIITQFLSYAKPIDLILKSVDIKHYFEDIYHLFEDQAKQKGIKFILQNNDSFNIKIDPDLIKQSLMNIIQNAFDAVELHGEVILSYYKIKKDMVIEIKDNGKGMSSEQKKKIFDLYFTTKKNGNGLGLSISQKIISQHYGTISVSSKINSGTTFKIIIPMQ
ncbi:MAG: ATP-binding protein [Ignavibacteriaceae bacterium]